MKKALAILILLTVLVTGGILIFREESRSVGCRIYADNALIYESTGTQPEDIFLSLDRDLAQIERLRIEYVDESGTLFPSVILDLNTAGDTTTQSQK